MKIKDLLIRLYLGNNGEKIAKYYNKQGCKIGKNFKCTTLPDFGSEPYLIEIGDNVYISTHVNFMTHDGGVWVVNNLKKSKFDKIGRIKIGNNVFLGMNSTIMPNVEIGNNVIIGLGSVVTKNVPDNEIWAGIPAKKICTVEEFVQKNDKNFHNTVKMSKEEKKEYYLGFYKK